MIAMAILMMDGTARSKNRKAPRNICWTNLNNRTYQDMLTARLNITLASVRWGLYTSGMTLG